MLDSDMNVQGQNTLQRLVKADDRCAGAGHWSELAVHCGLFAGPACSSFVAAYGMDSSQGELSGLLAESVSDINKVG